MESATFMSGLPPARQINANDTQIEGWVQRKDGPIQNIDFWQRTGARYFETMGIRLIEGRYLDDRDGDGAPLAVIVNQSTARAYWPGQSAIGHRVKPGFQGEWRTVVGVVEDVKNAGLDKPTGTELYIPMRQAINVFGLQAGYAVVRTKGDPARIAEPARNVIREVDPSLPVSAIRDHGRRVIDGPSPAPFPYSSADCIRRRRAGAGGGWNLRRDLVFGGAAHQRVRDSHRDGRVAARCVGNGAGPRIDAGRDWSGAGAAGALALTRFIRGLLFGVSSFDPVTFVAMAVVLTAVTLAACWIPARRATRVDPMVALRYE